MFWGACLELSSGWTLNDHVLDPWVLGLKTRRYSPLLFGQTVGPFKSHLCFPCIDGRTYVSAVAISMFDLVDSAVLLQLYINMHVVRIHEVFHA